MGGSPPVLQTLCQAGLQVPAREPGQLQHLFWKVSACPHTLSSLSSAFTAPMILVQALTGQDYEGAAHRFELGSIIAMPIILCFPQFPDWMMPKLFHEKELHTTNATQTQLFLVFFKSKKNSPISHFAKTAESLVVFSIVWRASSCYSPA